MNHCVVVFGVELFSLKPQSCVCMSVELHTTIYQKKWQYFIASLRGVCVCVDANHSSRMEENQNWWHVSCYLFSAFDHPPLFHHRSSFFQRIVSHVLPRRLCTCLCAFILYISCCSLRYHFLIFFFVFLLIAQESWIFFPLLLICRCNPIPLFAAQPPQPPRHTRIQSQPGRTWTISLMLMCASVLHCMMRMYAYMYSCICMTGNARNTIHDEKYGVE